MTKLQTLPVDLADKEIFQMKPKLSLYVAAKYVHFVVKDFLKKMEGKFNLSTAEFVLY